jgi:hypothetical protein
MPDTNETLTGEELLRVVRDEANAREERFREDEFENFLFHNELADYFRARGDNYELQMLRRDFLDLKKDKTMFERFELALADKFLGAIHVVELGMSTEPGVDGSADGLKSEYLELREWMVSLGLIKEELSREDSGRYLDVYIPEATRSRVVIGRTRPLVSTIIDVSHEGDAGYQAKGTTKRAQIDIAKRMVFSIPTGLYLAYLRSDPQFDKEDTLQSIEDMLQNPGSRKIVDPIRTTYYLRTAVLSEELSD